MPYTIEWVASAAKEFRALPDVARRRLVPKIDGLKTNPRPPGVKKLAGASDLYRIRVGFYRIVYQIDDGVLRVLVLRVGHRRDIYR
jgi:mRNA interferase RelE/StbE